jgi:hypothetical protein
MLFFDSVGLRIWLLGFDASLDFTYLSKVDTVVYMCPG